MGGLQSRGCQKDGHIFRCIILQLELNVLLAVCNIKVIKDGKCYAHCVKPYIRFHQKLSVSMYHNLFTLSFILMQPSANKFSNIVGLFRAALFEHQVNKWPLPTALGIIN